MDDERISKIDKRLKAIEIATAMQLTFGAHGEILSAESFRSIVQAMSERYDIEELRDALISFADTAQEFAAGLDQQISESTSG